MSLLLAGVAATGLVLSMNSPAAGVAALRAPSPSMQLKRVPGEGDPFGEKEGMGRGNRKVVEAFQPRGISDATVIKRQYIETDDEPWHADNRATTTLTMSDYTKSFETTLPFIAPEDGLGDALAKCKKPGDVDAAIAACISAGGREGCPAIVAATKFKGDMEKALKDGKPLPKPKAKKVSTGGATPGWANQGEGRVIGKVHDNSV